SGRAGPSGRIASAAPTGSGSARSRPTPERETSRMIAGRQRESGGGPGKPGPPGGKGGPGARGRPGGGAGGGGGTADRGGRVGAGGGGNWTTTRMGRPRQGVKPAPPPPSFPGALDLGDAHVDVLPAGRLVAVDREHVLARLQRLARLLAEGHLAVVGDEALHL